MHFEASSRFRKGRVGWFQYKTSAENKKINKYFVKKNRRLVNWWFGGLMS